MKRITIALFLLSLVTTSACFAKDFQIGNGKDYGIAGNPVLGMFGWFSGEVNIWKLDRSGEINIPVQFAHNPFDLDGDDYDINLFSIGTYYRKFFNQRQEGFFVQGGWLYTYADTNGKGTAEGLSASSDIHSILFGVGYRIISDTNGMFWAFGVGVGRSWGIIEDPLGDKIRSSSVALDIDLLKIGYSW
jgi:hypothetical protein